jgi:hypothetical protein
MAIYLYIKQCSHCQLQYFGKTSRDPFKYKGSGVHWRNHLKKYNCSAKTLEVFKFESIEEASIFAIEFSLKNDIVKSKSWANSIVETALDGGSFGYKQSKETIYKRVLKNTGKKRSSEQINNLRIAAQQRDNTNVGRNTARKVNTPDGIFNSLTEASIHFNVSIAYISKKVNDKSIPNWYKL